MEHSRICLVLYTFYTKIQTTKDNFSKFKSWKYFSQVSLYILRFFFKCLFVVLIPVVVLDATLNCGVLFCNKVIIYQEYSHCTIKNISNFDKILTLWHSEKHFICYICVQSTLHLIGATQKSVKKFHNL